MEYGLLRNWAGPSIFGMSYTWECLRPTSQWRTDRLRLYELLLCIRGIDAAWSLFALRLRKTMDLRNLRSNRRSYRRQTRQWHPMGRMQNVVNIEFGEPLTWVFIKPWRPEYSEKNGARIIFGIDDYASTEFDIRPAWQEANAFERRLLIFNANPLVGFIGHSIHSHFQPFEIKYRFAWIGFNLTINLMIGAQAFGLTFQVSPHLIHSQPATKWGASMRRSLIIKYMICPLMKSNPSPLYFSSRIINMFTKMPIMPCAAYISFVLCSRNCSALMPSYFNFKTIKLATGYLSGLAKADNDGFKHVFACRVCHCQMVLIFNKG